MGKGKKVKMSTITKARHEYLLSCEKVCHSALSTLQNVFGNPQGGQSSILAEVEGFTLVELWGKDLIPQIEVLAKKYKELLETTRGRA